MPRIVDLPLRSHLCTRLRAEHAGETVRVCGWVHKRRDHGGVVFVDLRDHSGLLQVVFRPEVSAAAHTAADTLRHEGVIAVRGEVTLRAADAVNPNLDTGAVEVVAADLEVLNSSTLPPYGWEDEAEDRLRLRYRYYELRRPQMQRNLRARARAASIVRTCLEAEDFVEVETPVLTRATPEGARDYLVPSRVHHGSFYALPQSPQLFKQLLMVGGLDRYYQIVKCFRDEDLRGNRQPEFTQIDIELAFATPQAVQALTGELLARLFRELAGVEIPLPIPRLHYEEAVGRYGSDAPDLRFGLTLCDLTDLAAVCDFTIFREAALKGGLVKGIRVPGGAKLTRRELDELTTLAIEHGARGMAWLKRLDTGWQSPFARLFPEALRETWNARLELEVGDLAVFSADQAACVHGVLGALRSELARRQNLVDRNAFRFVWVDGFPLFEREESGRLSAVHHPFTAPVVEDAPVLAAHTQRTQAQEALLKLRSQAYDLVLNGVELGGGSIRIHRAAVQEQVFRALGLPEETWRSRFGFLLEALESGAPPHGGIALGFDRILMFLCGTESIREVIAFPKTQRATDLLLGAPAEVDPTQLRELGVRRV